MANALKIKFYGERSLLVYALSFTLRRCLEDALEAEGMPGLMEWVSGYNTLLLVFDNSVSAQEGKQLVKEMRAAVKASPEQTRLVQIPVTYTGDDLVSVARQIGLTVDSVIERHSAPEYRVRMMGFMPGFPYLDGLDPVLHLPRRGSPRDRIEPGSVAIGGPHAGVYSVASPGGWHLLGKTDFVLFDPLAASGMGSDAAFRLKVGDRVRFVPMEVEADR